MYIWKKIVCVDEIQTKIYQQARNWIGYIYICVCTDCSLKVNNFKWLQQNSQNVILIIVKVYTIRSVKSENCLYMYR